MKYLLMLILTAFGSSIYAQNDVDCKALTGALPNIQQYRQFKLIAPVTCNKGIMSTNYGVGKLDDQLIFTVILTDTKPIANEALLGDINTKYELAKRSTDQTAIRLSRFKLGNKSFVAHDVGIGIKRVYLYVCVFKDRYVLELRLNNDKITNLDQFEDFISDYLATINDANLSK